MASDPTNDPENPTSIGNTTDIPSPTESASTGGFASRIRRGTIRLLEYDIPRGAAGATGVAVAQAPTLSDIKQGALTTEGEERYTQFENEDTPSDLPKRRRETQAGSRRVSLVQQPATEKAEAARVAVAPQDQITPSDPLASPDAEKPVTVEVQELQARTETSDLTHWATVNELELTSSGRYPNGYKFPPKHNWKEATAIGFKAFIRFSFGSIFGFLLLVYGLNVVAWGGMIFLLLCGAGDKYMCPGRFVHDCNSKYAPKSAWIEIDAQVLTALFCVTAFGLLPWRCKDLYHWYQYRVQKKHLGMRKLAAVHKGWFRLPGSHHLDPLVKIPPAADTEAQQLTPFPPEKGPEAPLTGVRAMPVAVWKMDFVVWMMMANSIFQVPLCGIMWGMNRFNRPSWATALLIVLGMLSAMVAGILQLIEGKKIKAREGIPLPAQTTEKSGDIEAS